MSKRTAEELISKVSSIVGEETNEDVIDLMEDIKDSIVPDPYEAKYNELLARYRARFESSDDVENISNNDTPTEAEDVHDQIEDITFDDLMEDV